MNFINRSHQISCLADGIPGQWGKTDHSSLDHRRYRSVWNFFFFNSNVSIFENILIIFFLIFFVDFIESYVGLRIS